MRQCELNLSNKGSYILFYCVTILSRKKSLQMKKRNQSEWVNCEIHVITIYFKIKPL